MIYVAALILLCCCAETIWLFILLCTYRFRLYIICTNLSHATAAAMSKSNKYNTFAIISKNNGFRPIVPFEVDINLAIQSFLTLIFRSMRQS